jgi:hypothetical protein
VPRAAYGDALRVAAAFKAAQSRIEIHPEATRDATLCWHGGGRRFAQGLRIPTENNYEIVPARNGCNKLPGTMLALK